MTKRCDICLKKNCGSSHNEVIKYLIYNSNSVSISISGQKRLGKDYLDKLRKVK